MNSAESKYIEKKTYRSRYLPERTHGGEDTSTPKETALHENTSQWPSDELPKFIPFLRSECGLEFFGRILEIGAGVAWLSAELSRLPKVVEVIATDFSPNLLKDHAPKVFRSLKANHAKITRTPGDYHQLDFPENYFDFVVCSAALHQAINMVQVLREVKRVLKPGGQFVAIREPVCPPMKMKSRAKRPHPLSHAKAEDQYSLGHYKELFKQAALPLRVQCVNLSSGLRYYMNKVVNGIAHGRYAFIGRKPVAPQPLKPVKPVLKLTLSRPLTQGRKRSRLRTSGRR